MIALIIELDHMMGERGWVVVRCTACQPWSQSASVNAW